MTNDEKCPGCGSGFATPHHKRDGWHYAQCDRRWHQKHGWETMCPAGCLQRQVWQRDGEIKCLRLERLFLARLAAEEPQFFNPLRVAEVKQLRDAILREAAEEAKK